MTLVIEAKYENGVLKPKQPLGLEEGAELQVTLQMDDEEDPLAAVIGIGDGPPEGDGAQNHDKYIYGRVHS